MKHETCVSGHIYHYFLPVTTTVNSGTPTKERPSWQPPMPILPESLELGLVRRERDVHKTSIPPFVTIRPDDHGLAVFPILGGPSGLPPIHHHRQDALPTRQFGHENIAQMEVPMGEKHTGGIRQHGPVRFLCVLYSRRQPICCHRFHKIMELLGGSKWAPVIFGAEKEILNRPPVDRA